MREDEMPMLRRMTTLLDSLGVVMILVALFVLGGWAAALLGAGVMALAAGVVIDVWEMDV